MGGSIVVWGGLVVRERAGCQRSAGSRGGRNNDQGLFFEQPVDDQGRRVHHLMDVCLYTIPGGKQCGARASFGSLDETFRHPLQAICQHRSLARANISCFIDDAQNLSLGYLLPFICLPVKSTADVSMSF